MLKQIQKPLSEEDNSNIIEEDTTKVLTEGVFVSASRKNKKENNVEKEIKSLKRENKKLQKDIIDVVKDNSNIITYKEGIVSISYKLDENKEIGLSLSANFTKNVSPEELHEKLYLKLLQSLNNIIEISVVNDKE